MKHSLEKRKGRWNLAQLAAKGVVVFLLLVPVGGSTGVLPSISRVSSTGSGEFVITGSGFGTACQVCEVIVTWPGGFRYQFPARSWSESRIVVPIVDIGKGVRATIGVSTPMGERRGKSIQISVEKVPRRDFAQVIAAPGSNSPKVFEYQKDLPAGDKGEDRINVSVDTPGCGKKVMVFDHARIVYRTRRFGEAKILSMPSAGCTRCAPLIVRWQHEPTGKLDYQVQIYRRRIEGICPDRQR